MEPTDSMTADDLHSRLLQLEMEMKEKEQNMIQAAMFGKSLLEENSDLRSRIDNLMKQQAADLEEKQQEICSLQSRAEVTASTEKWQQEEINNLRTELHNARERNEEEKKHELAAHKKQVDSLHLDVEHLQSVEQELRGRMADLEALLQTHLDRTLVQSTSSSFSHSEEMATLMEELTNLKMDLTEVQAKNIDLNGQLQQCQREKDTLSGRLRSASEEVEDLQCQASSYSRHLEENRKEVLELRAQLDASRVDSQAHNSKGNSIFSELDDRRQVLEKKMASLKVQNDQLKEKYSIEKEQNSKYKLQIAMALQMSNHKEDTVVQRLREQLTEAHAEIRTLIDKMQSVDSSKDDLTTGPRSGKDLFFLTTLQIEKDKAAKAQEDLQGKTLQYLDVTHQNVELTRQNKQLELERDRLRAQLLKAFAEKDEMLSKYEPDRVKEGKLQKRMVEKIDLGDSQFHAHETSFTSSGRPSDIFKPCTTTGRPSFVFRPCSTTGRPSNIFRPPSTTGQPSNVVKSVTTSGKSSDVLKPLNALERTRNVSEHSKTVKGDAAPVTSWQKENFNDTTLDSDLSFALPSGRKVSMADDVQVIYADGESSMAVLSSESDSSLPAEPLKKQKKPKAPKDVKYIKADEAPQLDCKTQ